MNHLPAETITVTVVYKDILHEITGMDSEALTMSGGATVMLLFNVILTNFPRIICHYRPGTLRLLLNGSYAWGSELLHTGDKITLKAIKNR